MLYSIKYKGFEKKVCVLQTVYISKIYKKISCTLKNRSDITKDLVVKRVKPLDAYIVSLPKRFDTLSTYGFSVDQELPDNPPVGRYFPTSFRPAASIVTINITNSTTTFVTDRTVSNPGPTSGCLTISNWSYISTYTQNERSQTFHLQ